MGRIYVRSTAMVPDNNVTSPLYYY